MKNIYYYLFLGIAWITLGCSAYKTASKQLDTGNYASAFETSIKVFQKDKSEKKKDKQLVLLQNSYLKANEEDERIVKELKLEVNPDYKTIYYRFKSLYDRVNAIRPLLPIYNDGKELKFPVKDYSADLARAKENYLDQYYTMALNLLRTDSKWNARQAYQYLTEIKDIDQYYRDVNQLQQEAYNKGANIVYITMSNMTGVPFPPNFRDNMLYSLTPAVNDFWTIITTNNSDPRDYEVNMILRQAFVGNDIITTNSYNYEREIVDGWDYARDRHGNIIRDSLGKTTKVDRYITVRAQVTEYVRHKEAMLSADVQIYNPYTGSMMDSYPIASNFAFNASFATMIGDRRALGSDILGLVNTAPVPFPNNYDMISQCGIELRRKLIDILRTFN